MVCPHAVIRSKVYEPAVLDGAPATFKSREARLPEWKGLNYTLQVAVEDCTGCGICVDVCPARNKSEARLKAINMQPQSPLRETRARELGFLPLDSRAGPPADSDWTRPRKCRCSSRCLSSPARAPVAARRPTSNCSRNLFGDRLIIANATGCSSIYGGNLPTTPYTHKR